MEEQKNIKEKTDWNIRPYLAIGLTAFLVIIGSLAFFFLVDQDFGYDNRHPAADYDWISDCLSDDASREF